MIKDGNDKSGDNKAPEKVVEYKVHEGVEYRVVLEEEDENSYINQFKNSFEAGLKGENVVISTGFPKLDNFISIRKKVYYCVGASTGTGKTTFVDEAFVFNPAEWYLNQKNPKIDLKILYWSLERSVDEKIARWISRKIFLEQQIVVTPDEILSRKVNFKLPKPQADMVRKYMAFIKEVMEKVVTIHAGSFNPQDIKDSLKDFALKRGKDEKVLIRKPSGYEYVKTIYVANNPDEFILAIVDPINRIRTREFGKNLSKKEAIDRVSEVLLSARDKYGYAVLDSCQFNRAITNPARLQSDRGVSPILDDFKESGNMSEDAEVVLAVFDPMALKVEDIYGYSLLDLKESSADLTPGNKKYRSLFVLKNSYGPSDVGIGMAFQPQCGIFQELPRPDQMTAETYADIRSNKFFLKNKK